MNFRVLYEYCLAKPGAVETFPFNESALVFKVAGKIFALTDVDRLPLCVSLKCDPDRAVELRERYDFVRPGYHLDKRHWNTVEVDGDADDEEVLRWIDDSYELVVKGLTRRQREQIEGM